MKKDIWQLIAQTQVLAADVVVAAAEPASNATRKAIWPENVPLLEVMVDQATDVIASSVVSQVTWPANAQILTQVPEEEVVVAMAVAAVNATSATKKDIWLETAQMETVAAWTKVPTRDQDAMMEATMAAITGAVEMAEQEPGDRVELEMQPVAGETEHAQVLQN